MLREMSRFLMVSAFQTAILKLLFQKYINLFNAKFPQDAEGNVEISKGN
jgi:hypothetical protein